MTDPFNELGNGACLWSPNTVVCAEELHTRSQKIVRYISADHHIIVEGSPGGRGGQYDGWTQGSIHEESGQEYKSNEQEEE